MRLRRLHVLPFVAFLIACAPLAARADVVRLSGVVLSSGSPVANATVALVPAAASRTRTDAQGRFTFEVRTGSYDVVVTKAGYVRQTLANVSVPSTGADVSIALMPETLSTLSQIAQVTSARAAINDSSSAMTTISRQRFVDAGQLQVAHVLDTIPGVISARPASGNPAAPGSITSPNLRGALDYEKATLLDGHPLINGKNGDYPTMLVSSRLFDSVEVVQGPTAYAPEINYGIGGTLNFRTADPSTHSDGEVHYGIDSQGGSFADARYSNTVGRLGYLFDVVSFGTQGPLRREPTYVALPTGSTVAGYGKISGSVTASGTTGSGAAQPVNGYEGIYPTQAQGALGNPSNALTTLVACCQYVTSNYASRGQLAKLQYHFSGSTVATLAYIGIQGSYDGVASGLTELGSVFAPTSAYASSGEAFAPGQVVPLNAKTTLQGATTLDNEPMFEGELRTTLGDDTILARFYSAILARETISDVASPSANYTTAPLQLWGTASIGGATVPFDGVYAAVTIPTPYSDSVEHDQLRGASFEYDHPTGNNVYSFAVDRNTSLTNAYSVTGSATNPLGNLSTSIAAGTRQIFTTYLLRGAFAIGEKAQLTLANYFNTYRSTYTPATSTAGFAFDTVTTVHDDPRVGFVYRATPDLSLRLSVGSAIAPPYPALLDSLNQSAAQAYTPGATTITIRQNSGGLLPETSFGYDVGGDWRLRDGSVLSVDGYLTNLRNQFVGVVYPSGDTYTPPGTTASVPIYVQTNANLAKSRYEGVDATLSHDPRSGYGFVLSAALQRAYAYDIPAGFYATASGSLTSNLGVVDGLNFYGFNTPYFNGISNKSEAYGQGYAGFHFRGSSGQYAELGTTYYGSNNTYDVPAFWVGTGTYRQPLGNRSLALQISVDNILGSYGAKWVQYGTGIGAPLANGAYGLRPTIPYGPTTVRFELSREF